MSIDENLILPYLAYGIYCEGDFDFFGHAVPELLLPYNIIDEKIKSKDYELLCFSKDAFSYSNNKRTFIMPYKKSKPKGYENFSKILKGLLSSRKNIEEYTISFNKFNTEYNQKRLKDAQGAYIKYQSKFNHAFEEFVVCQRNYTWAYPKYIFKATGKLCKSHSFEL